MTTDRSDAKAIRSAIDRAAESLAGDPSVAPVAALHAAMLAFGEWTEAKREAESVYRMESGSPGSTPQGARARAVDRVESAAAAVLVAAHALDAVGKHES